MIPASGNEDDEMSLKEHYIEVQEIRQQPDTAEENNQFTELILITEGQGVSCYDGLEYPLSAGDVYVVHPGYTHAYRQTEDLSLCRVIFDGERLGLDSLSITHLPGLYALFILDPEAGSSSFDSRLHLNEKQLRRTREIIDELRQEFEQESPGYRMVTQHLLLFLIGKLGRWYNQVPSKETEADPRINKSIAFMEQRFYEALTVEDLAVQSGMSERAYYRSFQKTTGVSPNQYLNSLRISQACDLLKYSKMTVTEVAMECGFQSGSYMNRLFKKQMEMTPLEYRKLNGV